LDWSVPRDELVALEDAPALSGALAHPETYVLDFDGNWASIAAEQPELE
jgi:hypothetical protein